MFELDGKRIFITGASSGIGRAVATMAASLGACVIACGRHEERLRETVMLCGNEKNHQWISFDVTDWDVYEDVFRRATADGKLDGLVHCAGIAKATPLRGLTAASVQDVLNVNAVPFFLLASQYAKRKYSNGGSLVAVSAVNAHYPQKCMSAYAASKLALEATAKTVALEMADRGIRVNCIIPGGVDTPMGDDVLPETKEYLSSKSLFGICQPEDVAHMAVFLLSDEAKRITGRSMYVDGGWLGQ